MDKKINLTKTTELCTSLVASRKYPLTKEDILEIWKPVEENLNDEEKILLLNCMVKTDSVFRWLNLINYVLPNLFSCNQYFINFVELVIDKVKSDLAQGEFIRSLINSGEKNPDVALELYSRVSSVGSEATIHYSGLFLGGAARTKFAEAFEKIKNGLKEGSIPVKVACIKALRVAFETKNKEDFSSEIWKILEQVANIDDPFIQSELANAYIDFDKFDHELCEQKLIEIAETADPAGRLTISNRLWFSNLTDKKKEIELLKICASDSDPRVLLNVARTLARKGQVFLKESLEIVKQILENYKEFNFSELDYYIEELCKNDVDYCIAEFDQWSETQKGSVFSFRGSMLSRKLQEHKKAPG